jgi:hypothetical protein
MGGRGLVVHIRENNPLNHARRGLQRPVWYKKNPALLPAEFAGKKAGWLKNQNAVAGEAHCLNTL